MLILVASHNRPPYAQVNHDVDGEERVRARVPQPSSLEHYHASHSLDRHGRGRLSAAALALPAAAATVVKIDVNGLAPTAAHARIVQAAKAACRVELRNSTTPDLYFQQVGCINDAVAEAEARLKTQHASNPGPSDAAGR